MSTTIAQIAALEAIREDALLAILQETEKALMVANRAEWVADVALRDLAKEGRTPERETDTLRVAKTKTKALATAWRKARRDYLAAHRSTLAAEDLAKRYS
jgi:tRNA(Glu) U13 pseudouridine synthase TruD